MKEQIKTPEKELNKMEASNLLKTEFKTLVIKVFNKLRRRVDELSENFSKEIGNIKMDIENIQIALAGVAQWIEHGPVNQRVAGSIPSQSTCLGCGPGPQFRVHERQPHIDVSLLLFLLPFPSP